MKKKALVIGTGSAGLIAAKELKEKNFDVRIIDKNSAIGGIWQSLPWKNYTLTSSKWVTEYGCFPMPDDYPDFVTNEHMLDYLESFVDHYQLRECMDFNVSVSAIERDEDGTIRVLTDRKTYHADYLVVSSGLHGKPFTPKFDGVENFSGETVHSSTYTDPDHFKGKKVLCVGLGESGVGLVSELAQVTGRLVVSSEGVAVAPRVIKGSQNPFDQMQFWKIGRFMIGYQEVLTTGLSWFYRRIPRFLKKLSITANLKFYSDYGVTFDEYEKWFPKALIPHHFHVKFWTKPANCPTGGNLTRTEAPPDDLFYLLKTGKLIPKGKVVSFDATGAVFEDGSREDVDTIMFNTGYQPGVSSLTFPGGWKYRHLDLFKGCIHPSMPNMAFIGMVRPTIGSIPAMAEMHSRVVAAYFSGDVPLPDESCRLATIESENRRHRMEREHMHDRFPHIYFFDEWMEQMSSIIGARPRLRDHLGSLEDVRAYFFGAPMPLRYRIYGMGLVSNAKQTYLGRVNRVWGSAFGKWAFSTVLIHFFIPYLLGLGLCLWALMSLGWSVFASVVAGLCFLLAYRFVDLFRYLLEKTVARPLAILVGGFFVGKLRKERPDYENPAVFQSLN